jgi:hypothetical protein
VIIPARLETQARWRVGINSHIAECLSKTWLLRPLPVDSQRAAHAPPRPGHPPTGSGSVPALYPPWPKAKRLPSNTFTAVGPTRWGITGCPVPTMAIATACQTTETCGEKPKLVAMGALMAGVNAMGWWGTGLRGMAPYRLGSTAAASDHHHQSGGVPALPAANRLASPLGRSPKQAQVRILRRSPPLRGSWSSHGPLIKRPAGARRGGRPAPAAPGAN